ncbi:MAG: TonB-dependent receptor [Caulobacteraceae bacterium]
MIAGVSSFAPGPLVTARRIRRVAVSTAALAVFLCSGAVQAQITTPVDKPDDRDRVSEVVVTASRLDLLGVAATASQGSATQKELALRPIYRIGQLLETVPGLVVTVHSGEGKANQYLIRGFNLDHGTDIANFVDDMPVNRPTNTHGQGYSDMNFLMPELAAGMDYTKGPYYAAVGDFGAVASTHTRLLNELPTQMSVSAGTLGDQSLFLGGTHDFGPDDRLLAAVAYSHLDGPWEHPDNFHKLNAALRYSHGTQDDGYSLTAMYDHSHGNLTTDQPLRAVEEGLIGRYGSLDPTDGSRSERFSLSGHYATHGDDWSFDASAYYIHSTMTLWNDFTHYLDDPVNGDQEEQTETRNTWGGQAAYKLHLVFDGIETDTTLGLQARYDDVYVDRRHTYHRSVLNYCEDEQPAAADGAYVAAIAVPAVNGACQADRVHITDLGPYAENTTHWTPWLRTIVGVREEYYQADDHSFISGFTGSGSQTLFQPKGSLVLGPWEKTEVYVSAGRGFHSDDVRGVFGTVPLEGEPATAGKTPLLAAATGEEIGLRTNLMPKVSVQLAVFQEDFKSELAYDQDVGQDTASAPSRRQGIELSAEYRPYPWIELNSDLAFSRARYTGDYAAFDLDGPYIANAPSFIGSFGALVDNLGPWFGGLQWRDLGPYPIADGTEFPKDKGYSEINVDAGYKISRNLKLQVDIFNLFNSHANAAAYYYTTRLPGEPAGGVAGYQVHPLEPISARFSATATF